MKKLTVILLLFATGCMHQLTAPLSDVPVTSMANYFWTGSAINFKDNSTGFTTDEITFRDSSNLLLADDADATGKLHTTIVCTISPDTVFAQSFVSGSILDLDNGSYFSPLDTVTLVPHVLSAAVITGDSAYVATDSGVWSASVSGRFAYDGIDSISDIDALASSPGGNIYAATRSGHIWVRDPGSRKWSPFTTTGLQSGAAITALACDASALYAVAAGQTGVYQCIKGGYTWTQLDFLITKSISAIRANENLNSTEYLAIGTIDGTVAGYPASGTGPQFQHSIGTTGTNTIYDLAVDQDKFLAAATQSGIYQSDQTLNFTSQPAITNSGTTSLIFDPSGLTYFISGELVYSAPSSGGTIGSPSHIAKFYDGTPLKLFSQSANSYLLTNTSLYQHTASTGWDTVKGFPRSYYPNLQGGLLLLKSNPTVDSSWNAGTLVTRTEQSYPITARLLSRLDSLVIGGKSYSDVLVVQYAHELAGGIPDSTNIPYWVIYYQRGRGPIMIDKVNIGGGAPERRVVSN